MIPTHSDCHGLRRVSPIAAMALLGLFVLGGPLSDIAAAEDVVVINGKITNTETETSVGPMGFMAASAAMSALTDIYDALDQDTQDTIYDTVNDALKGSKGGPPDGNFTIRYSQSTMRMDQGKHTFMIVISDPHVGYFMMDHSTGSGMKSVAEIQGRVSAAQRLAPIQARMYKDFEIKTAPGAPVEFQGITATPYTYDYKGGMSLGQMALVTGMMDFVTDGSAWIANGIDGQEVVEAFYRNLSEAVSQSPGVDNYFAGLMASQLGLIEKGLPIINRVTTQAKMGGRILSTSTTNSTVTSVVVERWGPNAVSGYLSESAVPDNYKMTSPPSPGAATSGDSPGGAAAAAAATAGANSAQPAAGGSQAPAKPAGCDCSCEAFQKIQGMSRQERRAMEKSPEAMAMAMCMGQCMPKWMGCAQR